VDRQINGHDTYDQPPHSRLGELEGRLSLAPRVEYRVALRFTDQTDEEFLAQNPWWGERSGTRITLSFGTGVVPAEK
jgi:hypothetical protein